MSLMIRNLVLAGAFAASPLLADEPTTNLTCLHALNACQEVVEAQDQAIVNLKAALAETQDKLADSKPPALPTWAAVVVGIAAGVIIGVTIK
jgi:ElaB/YqjD/DUF883 family membrane-anchored ribosome-binding protein